MQGAKREKEGERGGETTEVEECHNSLQIGEADVQSRIVCLRLSLMEKKARNRVNPTRKYPSHLPFTTAVRPNTDITTFVYTNISYSYIYFFLVLEKRIFFYKLARHRN